MKLLGSQLDMLRQIQPLKVTGTVAAVRGLTVQVENLPLPVGAVVRFERGLPETTARSQEVIRGEVIGFDGRRGLVMLFGEGQGIGPGMRVVGEQAAPMIGVGESLLGRVIDGFGGAIDGGPSPADLHPYPLHPPPAGALRRARIRAALPTGVRAIDGFLTIGCGQRIGIFSAAGVGKSTLLGAIARSSGADVNVIALIGERGREVREFLEESLGDKERRRTVAVVATGDESPLRRVRAALAACSAAEYFRDGGARVLLLMDSITRLAQAQRQIGLAVGEQPATRGFPPSVFALLPSVLERAGAMEGSGSITAFYSVLVEGDDMDEPVSDAVRGVLDGHIVLSRRLAARGHYPAIDLLQSVSRVSNEVCDPDHRAARRQLLRLLSAYEQAEELINIGAYSRGSDPDCDAAMALRPALLDFLRQSPREPAAYQATCESMQELSAAAGRLLAAKSAPRPTATAGRLS